jgi:Polyketide cyclase / dehydrase and lipid transport
LISAERRIPHEPKRVFAFLADLRNHWRLEERTFVEVDDVGERGGVIRLRGPLGLSRRVRTTVLAAESHSRVAGRAELSGGTVGLVVWAIEPDQLGSRVRLSAEVASASVLDRLLLTLGGNVWLRRLFERALANLERAL